MFVDVRRGHGRKLPTTLPVGELAGQANISTAEAVG